jgi:hypothetical protein
MPDALEVLEHELRIHAPEIASALRPGLALEQLHAISTRLPFEIPDAAKQLYIWHDGTEIMRADDRAQLFPGGQFLPLEESVKVQVDALESGRQSGDAFWDPGWLPIFTDNWGGWHVVVCAGTSHPVLSIYVVDLPDTSTAFADLPGMVEALSLRWRTGAFRQTEGGSVEPDLRAVAALYRAEDGQLPDIDGLVADLNDGPLEDHLSALALLRTRLYPEAVPGLIRLLQSGTLRGRKAAAELLGSIGVPAARNALLSVSEGDPDEIIRAYAKKSLEQLLDSKQA